MFLAIFAAPTHSLVPLGSPDQSSDFVFGVLLVQYVALPTCTSRLMYHIPISYRKRPIFITSLLQFLLHRLQSSTESTPECTLLSAVLLDSYMAEIMIITACSRGAQLGVVP